MATIVKRRDRFCVVYMCDFFVKVTLNRQLTIFRAAQPPKKVISSRKLFPL